MIKKILFLFFIIIFFNNCGYTPIYSKKSQSFEIVETEYFGEKKVNKILSNKLKIYKKNPEAIKKFNIFINSKTTKATITKDKKGNPTQFSMGISITLKINNEIEKTFLENSTYNNSEDKFDLRKYEDNLIQNMTETIFSEMILFLQTNS
tara:strand:- start:1372 stop:1821 length:450 start_codon:yes stop_codon:yes gene_type:complete